jgi:hypothetical protein
VTEQQQNRTKKPVGAQNRTMDKVRADVDGDALGTNHVGVNAPADARAAFEHKNLAYTTPLQSFISGSVEKTQK